MPVDCHLGYSYVIDYYRSRTHQGYKVTQSTPFQALVEPYVDRYSYLSQYSHRPLVSFQFYVASTKAEKRNSYILGFPQLYAWPIRTLNLICSSTGPDFCWSAMTEYQTSYVGGLCRDLVAQYDYFVQVLYEFRGFVGIGTWFSS